MARKPVITFKDINSDLIVKWQGITDLLAKIISVPAALIKKTDTEYMEVLVASKTDSNPYHLGDKEKWDGLYCETVIKTQNELLVSDATADSHWNKNPDIKLGMIAYLGYPINFPDKQPFGTLCVLDNKENAFSPLHKQLLLQLRDTIEMDIALLRKDALQNQTEARLKDIEWMLSPKPPQDSVSMADNPDNYGDLTKLNSNGIILKSIGAGLLKSIANDYIELLGTSSAIYEKNGDYAFGIFASSWCRMMDCASRKLCNTSDNVKALKSKKWLCHESCWTDCSRIAIAEGKPTEIECNGGIRMYCEPIMAGDTVVGAINFGYSDPPKEKTKLQRLADTYQIEYDTLVNEAHAYQSRPPFVIEMAKKRLHGTAMFIGAMVEKTLSEEALKASEKRLKTILDTSPFPTAVVDTNDDKIKYWSQSSINLFGHNPRTTQEWYELAYPDPKYRQEVIDRWKPFLEIAQDAPKAANTGEYRIVCKDGSVKTCELFAQFIPGILIVTLNDITKRKQTEDALRKSTSSAERYLNIAAEIILSLDAHGTIALLNDSGHALLGYESGELVGRNWFDTCLLKEFSGEIRNVFNRLMVGFEEGFANYENTVVTKTGETRSIYWHNTLLKDTNGRITGLLSSGEDITERKQAREVLVAEKRYSESLITSLPGVFYLISQERRFLRWNKKFEIVTGRSAEEMAKISPIDLFEGTDKQVISAAIQSVFTLGQDQIEARIVAKNGKRIPYQFSGERIIVDGVPCLIGLGMDITKRKKIGLALETEKERLAVTLRSIGDGVITTDTNGNIVLMNKVAEDFTGWTQDQAQGKSLDTVFKIINESTREPHENPVQKVLSTGKIIELANHTLLISRDGTERVVADTGAPILDNNANTIGVVLVFRDTTEKQKFLKITQKSQRLESLGVLAGGIAHDFNNLLGGIFGYIDMASEEIKEPAVSRYLSKALSTIDRARALTGQLLTFAKGGAPIKKVEYLHPFVQEAAQFALSGSTILGRYQIPEKLWPCDIDKSQIGQVIENIVINAHQAMPNGGQIDISAQNISLTEKQVPPLAAGNYVKLSIKDQGVGIPKEFLPNIFDPFYTTKPKGHGLGLSSCYSIVKRHCGYIEVESEPGKGSTFHVYLLATLERVSTAAKTSSVAKFKGSGTLLVMDDEEVMRKIIAAMLESLGYSVVLKENGEDAVTWFAEETKSNRTLAGMIFDLTIPGGMGGREAIGEIRKICLKTPVFVASGYADDPIMSNPKDYGFSASICKPFSKEELVKMLNENLQGRQGT